MKLHDLFPKNELAAQVEAKMVKITPHPNGKLRILNYTQMATFTPELWNHVTDLCRGLIVDEQDNVIARPFRKFWNLDDARHPETLSSKLPAEPPIVTRKMDGSLGIGYQVAGRWAVATRGSFSSEQAIWASRWFSQNVLELWPKGWTPLFEIVYPENQIVVRYDYSGLVLLALVNIETGVEMSYERTKHYAELNRVRVVEKFDRPLPECVAEDTPNEEGYVAAWERPGTTPLRVKIKYATYCRLHKLLTQTNAVTVWEMLRDGLDMATLTADVPAEFRDWIDGVAKKLRADYLSVEAAAVTAWDGYSGEKNITNPADKKAFALYVTGSHADSAPILFAMVTGKDYAPIIWKRLRPRGDEKTFKVDAEG